ncbi:hypothetical protein HY837_03670 [archaeon]|nr:hypothetical protein [archaeon]
METTTIAVSTHLRDEIKEFGSKGESYDEIISRLVESAKERQLQEFLLDEKGTTLVSDALVRAKNRWQK